MPVASAQLNLRSHLVALAARNAHRFNAGLCSQRRQMKQVFKLESKLKALDRDRLLAGKNGFLSCSYLPGLQFVSSLNALRRKAPSQAEDGRAKALEQFAPPLPAKPMRLRDHRRAKEQLKAAEAAKRANTETSFA